MAMLESRLGQTLLNVGPDGAEVPGDLTNQELIHAAAVTVSVLRQVCLNLAIEVDDLRARCAALEDR